MPRLFLVRHAQPDFAGNYDSITPLGEQQARWLGEHFASRGLRFARAVCGSLVRQQRTLEQILARLEEPPAPGLDPRFNEYDPVQVLAAFGTGNEAALRAAGDRRAYFGVLRDSLQAWSRRAEAPGGGETWADFGARVLAAAAECGAGLEPRADVLVVTSGGVIGRLVGETLGAGADAAIELNLQTRNTGVTELVLGRTASRLLSFNAVPHLERPDRAHAVTHS
jgi:broad specificity phosphatase PhoE